MTVSEEYTGELGPVFSATAARRNHIAATALMYGLTVVTRNVPDDEPTGVAVLNPFT
jgi:predicted nucleic acid-binding protein